MAYCTKADLVQRFGLPELVQLTDQTNTPPSAADDDEITKACDETTSLIDSYVAALYQTPLSPVPTIVRKWACDITRKALWKERAGPDSVVTLNCDAAMAQLKDVAKGIATLPDAAGSKPSVIGGMAYTRPTAVFNTDGLL